jgi:predicted ATP-dependent endonuclease of OLD family
MLNYFRAEAERRIVEKNNKNVIYAIEEPETAQHPNHQKMLIEALIELSNKENHQIIITTHTPEIAKMVNENNLIIIKKDDNNNPILIEDEEDKLKAIVETLGIHPFFSNKVVVCVEGEYDIKFLTNVNQYIDEYKNIIDLEKEEISLIPLQGGNLKNWVNRNYLKDSNIIEIHIYDRDSNSGKNTEQYKKQCDEINGRDDKSYAFMTEKRELENYIHKSIIQNEFNITLDGIENYDIEDIPTFIKNKSTNKNENAIKGILNGKLSQQITKEHLEELEAFEEIKGWFEKIKELAQ